MIRKLCLFATMHLEPKPPLRPCTLPYDPGHQLEGSRLALQHWYPNLHGPSHDASRGSTAAATWNPGRHRIQKLISRSPDLFPTTLVLITSHAPCRRVLATAEPSLKDRCRTTNGLQFALVHPSTRLLVLSVWTYWDSYDQCTNFILIGSSHLGAVGPYHHSGPSVFTEQPSRHLFPVSNSHMGLEPKPWRPKPWRPEALAVLKHTALDWSNP